MPNLYAAPLDICCENYLSWCQFFISTQCGFEDRNDRLSVMVSRQIKYTGNFIFLLSKTVSRRYSVRKVLLKICQNLQENTCVRVSFLITFQSSEVFSCKFGENSKNTFFHRTPQGAASVVFLRFNLILHVSYKLQSSLMVSSARFIMDLNWFIYLSWILKQLTLNLSLHQLLLPWDMKFVYYLHLITWCGVYAWKLGKKSVWLDSVFKPSCVHRYLRFIRNLEHNIIEF